MRKNLKDDTMKELEIQKFYNYPIHPRDSKLYSDNGFVIIDVGRTKGTHWCAFHVKNHKSFYFDSFGFQPDKFQRNHLPKPITYHKYEIQEINSKFCGLYVFYLIDRINHFEAILKMYFKKL